MNHTFSDLLQNICLCVGENFQRFGLSLMCISIPLFLVVSAVQAAPKTGAIAVYEKNPYYFQNANGKPLILIGDYTWGIFSDVDYEFEKFFDSLKARGLNFARVWLWWGCERFALEGRVQYVEGMVHVEPFLRMGPGTANDEKPKYDLSKFDQRYFDRVYKLCDAAKKRGIYLQLIMMDAWMIKHAHLWKLHAFHRDNNINGIDGDLSKKGVGTDGKQGFCSMGNPKAFEVQKEYIKKVVDTTNEFDNIYYEIANENYYSREWELALCDFIKEYEKSKSKQHLTMPRDLPSHSDVVQKWDPKVVYEGMLAKRSLKQPLIFDTDWTINKNDEEVRKAMWAGVIGGGSFNYMDDSLEAFRIEPKPDGRAALHSQMDYLAAFVKKIKPWEMEPDNGLIVKGDAFALASSSELAAYLPYGGSATLNLEKMKGNLRAWWFNTRDGKFGKAFIPKSGKNVEFNAPDKSDWALLIKKTY